MTTDLFSSFVFEDLHIGQKATHSVVVCDSLISSFANLTGDRHPLHTDREYSVSNGFQDILAHGVLLTSLSSKLIGMDLPGERALLLSNKSEYIKPVYPGDVLLFSATVSFLIPRARKG